MTAYIYKYGWTLREAVLWLERGGFFTTGPHSRADAWVWSDSVLGYTTVPFDRDLLQRLVSEGWVTSLPRVVNDQYGTSDDVIYFPVASLWRI